MLKPLNFGQYQALKRYSFNQINGVDDTVIDNIINAFIERGENCYAVNE